MSTNASASQHICDVNWSVICPMLAWTLAGLLASSVAARAQDGSNVLLVVNTASAAATPIAARYAQARAIPPDHVVRLQTATSEEIARPKYEKEIEGPIGEWIAGAAAHDRILYIVLVKGMPLRISGTPGRSGTVASVDSELTLLYRKLAGTSVLAVGPTTNPYFNASRPLADAKPFSHADQDIYLVSRLDGFNQADAIGLIDRGASPKRDGVFLLDAMGTPGSRVADAWLQATASALIDAGHQERVVHETTAAGLQNRRNVLGYASWGSNDPSIRTRRLGLGFVPGALAAMFVSTDARTLREPPEKWRPGDANDRTTPFQGSPQSLTGDLIREGVTGVAGYVAEPFLDGTLRPDVLFPAYVAGFNLIESFYLAIPHLSWQAVVFGDPLCAPFRTKGPPAEELTPAVDADSELPKYFLQRRIEFLTSTGIDTGAVKLLLKGEARRRHNDTAGTRQALEEATAIEPQLTGANRILAGLYEQAGEHDQAIERYRRVLTAVPGDLLSINNLAYALAVHKKDPAEALPFAEKAYAISKGAAAPITDTLGWIHHLLGNRADAEKFLSEAAAAAPDNAEIQLHLAHAYVALGRKDAAARAIARSLQLSPALANRDDVKDLRAQLGSSSK